MKKFATAALAAIALGTTSCATIFTHSTYPVTFTSTPDGADIRVVNRSGVTIFAGTTPATVRLKAAAGYMKREEYAVTLTCAGHAPQTFPVICNLDGWYFGNLVIGWWIGMLIIDPASGAMYRIPDEQIHTDLRPAVTATRELRIVDISQVSDRSKLVKIN